MKTWDEVHILMAWLPKREMTEADIGLCNGKSMWPAIESARRITSGKSYEGLYVTHHTSPSFGKQLIREMGLAPDTGSVIVNGSRLAWDGTTWGPPPKPLNWTAEERANG